MAQAQRRRPPLDMTVAEFLEWADAQGTEEMWQLRDGEPEMMVTPAIPHVIIRTELIAALHSALRGNPDGCRPYGDPGVIPRNRSDRNMLVPDVGVACGNQVEGRALTNPVALFEILSPPNTHETRANVWAYMTIPSVVVIVLISSIKLHAEVFLRGPDSFWPAEPEPLGAGGIIRLPRPKLDLPLRPLYADLPFAGDP